MKLRLLLLAILFTLFPFHRAAAQGGGYVNVTATVLDPNGVPYAGCRGSIDFVTPANATSQPTLYRGLFTKNFSISQCDSFAKFSITLAATDQIDCGLGSLGCGQWHFSITSQDGKTGFQVALAIGPGNPNQATNEDISTLLQAAAAPLPISSLSQFLSLNNNWTGLNSFSKQITSTVPTGTAPFSIASTTVVPNLNSSTLNGATFAAPGAIGGTTPSSGAFTTLSASGQITSTVSTGTAPFSIASTTVTPNLNAQLHNGLSAPASAIVGITDSQTLSNKILTRVQAGTTAPTCSVTGAGTGATCSLASSSNDNSGNMQINTGTTPGTSGIWTLTFSSTWASAGFCSVSLGSGNTTLNARATVFNNSNGSAASQSGNWDNNGVAPTASQATAFLINYVCIGH